MRASNHMSGNRKIFVTLNETIGSNVTFGDGSKISMKGKRNTLIRLKDGRHNLINDIFYVPNIKNNILSLGKLLEKNYKVDLKNRCCAIRDVLKNLIEKVPMRKNRMFLLNINNDVAKCVKARVGDSS